MSKETLSNLFQQVTASHTRYWLENVAVYRERIQLAISQPSIYCITCLSYQNYIHVDYTPSKIPPSYPSGTQWLIGKPPFVCDCPTYYMWLALAELHRCSTSATIVQSTSRIRLQWFSVFCLSTGT